MKTKQSGLLLFLLSLVQINHCATSCTSRYGSLYTGTCMAPSSCKGAILNNLCSGNDKCCIDDMGSTSTSNSFISEENFLAIVGDNARTREIYKYLKSPNTSPTCFQTASFISQLAYESGNFIYSEELGLESYFSKYDGRADLGNTKAGDGAKYRGRGFIQITGRSNYARAGAALGLPLENDPELAAFPSVAAAIAVWFWTKGSSGGTDLNTFADGTFYSYSMMTSKINGGLNGLKGRTDLLKTSSSLLSCGKILKGNGGACTIDSSTTGTCKPLCVTGLEGEDFCSCTGTTYDGKCAGPKNIKCCQDKCDGILDMAFVIDSSGSIASSDFTKALNFVSDVIKQVNVSKNRTHVGIINFSDQVQLIAYLNNYTNPTDLLNIVAQIPHLRQSTNTGEALQKSQEIFNLANGMRDSTYGATKLIIVLTDGASNGNIAPIPVANQLKQSGINIISIGVGPGPNKNELNGISSSGSYYLLDGFSKVSGIVDDMTQLACTEPAVVSTKILNLVVAKNAFRYFRYSLANYNSKTIKINVFNTQGKTKLFTSFEKRNPNDLDVITDSLARDFIAKAVSVDQNNLQIPANSAQIFIGIKGLEDQNTFSLSFNSDIIDTGPCGVSNPCLNNGICMAIQGKAACICINGYYGLNCESNAASCTPNQCNPQNGGVCVINTVKGPTCICPVGTKLPNCESTVTGCSPNPCLNGGSCSAINRPGAVNCACASGYTGRYCEAKTSDINCNLCLNNAACYVQLSRLACNCTAGFTGQYCQTKIGVDVCTPNPCENSGTCRVNSTGSAFCSCSPGFNGSFCEQSFDVCSPNPCKNNGTCFSTAIGATCQCAPGFTNFYCDGVINACSSSPCQNGGICSLTASGGYTCSCASGFGGSQCLTIISNPCLSTPCQNGGTCSSNTLGTQYSCICPSGTSGANCQTVTSYNCRFIPCKNAGTCTLKSDGTYACVCAANYFGFACDVQLTASTCSLPDTNSSYCSTISKLGICKFSYLYNSIPIPVYCPTSCGGCKTSFCADILSNSGSLGTCSTLKVTNPNACRKTCGLCGNVA